MKPAYYNEHDDYAAQLLRNLIAAGHIAPGDVDTRSIEDVAPDDLAGYGQCHFFAGVGVWSYALRRAGVPDDFPVWTGSCPCQPFSSAGKGAGFADERHLWPAFFHLIRERRPVSVLGEQVASHDGLNWLDLVQDDMEGADYAFWAVDTCAAGFGAPHIRQRLYWVGHAIGARLEGHAGHGDGAAGWSLAAGSTAEAGDAGGMADAERERVCARGQGGIAGAPGEVQGIDGQRQWLRPDAGAGDDGVRTRPGPTNGFWADADWLFCRDGKWRPVEARVQQMVDGAPLRVGLMCPDLQTQVEEKLNEASIRLQTEAGAILREVRDAVGAAHLFEWGGGIRHVHEAQILLARLLEYTGEDGRQQNATHGAGAPSGPQRDVRVLWRRSEAGDPSRKRRLAGQQHREFADSLRLLSSAVARFASEAGYPGLYEDAPASFPLGEPRGEGDAQDSLGLIRPPRVGRLRAYGNAIVAPQAEAFIRAVMEIA